MVYNIEMGTTVINVPPCDHIFFASARPMWVNQHLAGC